LETAAEGYEMTRKLQPGRELDALVAERVMGYPGDGNVWHVTGDYARADDIPHYSTDIAAAWEAAETLLESHELEMAKLTDGRYFAQFIGGPAPDGFHPMHKAIGDSAAHAICLAALKAVGVSTST
jgi:hypothetical protein